MFVRRIQRPPKKENNGCFSLKAQSHKCLLIWGWSLATLFFGKVVPKIQGGETPTSFLVETQFFRDVFWFTSYFFLAQMCFETVRSKSLPNGLELAPFAPANGCSKNAFNCLWFQPVWNHMIVKLDHFCKNPGEHEKCFKPPFLSYLNLQTPCFFVPMAWNVSTFWEKITKPPLKNQPPLVFVARN